MEILGQSLKAHILGGFAAFGAVFLLPTLAQAGGWITTTEGCHLWSKRSEPQPSEIAEWSGDCVDRKASGNGVGIWTYDLEGARVTERYVGEMHNGKLHGNGTMYYVHGNRYEGQFQNGMANGQGTMYWWADSRYEGQWQNDKYHGQGTFYAKGLGRYEGEWRNGSANGQGTMYYVNGNRYEGQWQDGKKHGQGTGYYAFGGRYEGQWQYGTFQGEGTFYFLNGNRYEGQYINGLASDGFCFDATAHSRSCHQKPDGSWVWQ